MGVVPCIMPDVGLLRGSDAVGDKVSVGNVVVAQRLSHESPHRSTVPRYLQVWASDIVGLTRFLDRFVLRGVHAACGNHCLPRVDAQR